jgi:thioester reductase-like protein
VTGVTGFIGREVVRRLLGAGRRVVALARAQNGQSAAERVVATLQPVAAEDHLEVVQGDLALPGCGLKEVDWRLLRNTIETVIHCAGETVFFPGTYASFRAGHIDGPLTLLHGLHAGRLRHWAHLSTAYVCGRRSGVVFECEGDVGQGFRNPYEQIKLESEEAVRLAGIELGITVRVFRPSIVTGPAPETAGGMPSNLFFSFIRMVATLARLWKGSEVPLRIAAVPQARFNIVPVKYVAEAVVALTDQIQGVGQTLHVVVSDAPSQEAILDMITGRFGVRGLSLVDPTDAPINKPSPLERRVARMLSGYHDYLCRNVQFDDTNARRLLTRCGIQPPALSREVVYWLIDQALRAKSLIT